MNLNQSLVTELLYPQWLLDGVEDLGRRAGRLHRDKVVEHSGSPHKGRKLKRVPNNVHRGMTMPGHLRRVWEQGWMKGRSQ